MRAYKCDDCGKLESGIVTGQELAFVRRHSLGLVEVLDAALVLKTGAAGEIQA